MNGHYTHRKYLTQELENLKEGSKVLELGVGIGSSEIINSFCKKKNIHVTGIESDITWFNNMKKRFELDNYQFKHVTDWKLLPDHINEEEYDLVFVDQAPWSARIDAINLLAKQTKVFIVHDYDYYNQANRMICDDKSWWFQNYGDKFVLIEHYELRPPTLVMRKK